MSLRDKDQQIRLLIREREEQKFQAELMAKRAEEWREKFEASELERSHMTSEADDEVVELRRLAQEFEDENKRLAERLAQREQLISDTQFKLDELECNRQELKRELAERMEQLDELEQERRDLLAGSRTGPELITERQISRAKFEREIEELKEKLMQKDESMMQLRSSLEMRKNEVTNLQTVAADLERKLKIESERSERHLKRIDEINLELRAAEEKLATKMEENEIQEKQVKQLRQEVRSLEEKLEQVSLARKKDVDILHNKLSAARGNACRSTTPNGSPALHGPGSTSSSTPIYKTPTPQDEIVRLQMEIRDLKDQLIDREAELDCNRRDLEVMRRKMETRTLEVDCNNQELARRCQDLLEQNRQSEDTVKQLLKSTTEHSAQLMRATEDLKESNGKCIKLRDEVNELEGKLDNEMKRAAMLQRENNQLKEDNQMQLEQIDHLRNQVDTLNEQLGELCEQLDIQAQNLHKDRELLADQLSEHEINSAQLRHDLAKAKQDLRTNKLQTQEVISERDRLRSDLDIKEKYIRSRNDMIEQMRHELDDSQKSLADYKNKLESLRTELEEQYESKNMELSRKLDSMKEELEAKMDECMSLRGECDGLKLEMEKLSEKQEQLEDEKFDEMRRKHSAELDELKLKLMEMEKKETTNDDDEKAKRDKESDDERTRQDYETQIEFLNSLVVDMQRKADDYKNRLASLEAIQLMQSCFVGQNGSQLGATNGDHEEASVASRSSTLKRNNVESKSIKQQASGTVVSNKRHVRIQDPVDGQISLLKKENFNNNNNNNNIEPDERQLAELESQLNGTLVKASKSALKINGKIPMRNISGRPYCDICQIYDLHHTIYCPKVGDKLNEYRRRQGNNEDDQLDDCTSDSKGSLAWGQPERDQNGHHQQADNQQQPDSEQRNNNYLDARVDVDEMFREYEESLESGVRQFYPQFSSLRRAPHASRGDPHRQQAT